MVNRVEILDSTLRDGAQGEGISFSVMDKIAITRLLDELGVQYIEAGNPVSNPKDLEFFERAKDLELKHSTLVAFGSTRRKDAAAGEDANVQALVRSGAGVCCIFGKCWDLHVREIIHTTPEENRAMITDTISYLTGRGITVFFDAEHFFDGYKANPAFALGALDAAVEGGATCLALCDTNGGCFPSEIYSITKAVIERFPAIRVGIHCHNDTGMAAANSVAAVEAGATHIQGTWLGFGERCGNANLSTIIPGLQLKKGILCIPPESLANITPISRKMAEIANLRLKSNEPFIGASAFAHKAGMHADGVLKVSHSFEHISPDAVGNERRFLMSEQTGRTAVLRFINKIAPHITKDAPETHAAIQKLKQLELEGYQFDGADSSFDLMIRKGLGLYSPYFELISYKVLDEAPSDETGNSATATIKIRVAGEVFVAAGEGDGPVHALDVALRSSLQHFYPMLADTHLIDYKVRVMESSNATAAKVRVLITSTDGEDIWTTVGASSDVIQASWIALVDSLEYNLIHRNIAVHQ